MFFTPGCAKVFFDGAMTQFPKERHYSTLAQQLVPHFVPKKCALLTDLMSSTLPGSFQYQFKFSIRRQRTQKGVF